VKQLNAPIKEVGLPSVDPLLIPSLTIAAGTSAVALDHQHDFHGIFQHQFLKNRVIVSTSVSGKTV
jgi:hypothetical protein